MSTKKRRTSTRIKVSDDEKERRAALGLPKTKALRYYVSLSKTQS